ncbi:expressed unknown protein [Seminavis robusta]|uniref:Uncharacterized protein n=1 Tax=Seminavis robusta TaxID=568900 RepID=A0A9N8HSG4_9STRA|nr:expressed unknown protein [Seminavis robusta]|eukprot:Sro1441_g272920.1 n/a (214) ;mRNA; f:10552-11193
MLKRITKVALNAKTKSERNAAWTDRDEQSNKTNIVQLSLTRACVLSGTITQGIVKSNNVIYGFSAELKEASALFKYVSENNEAEANRCKQNSETAMEVAVCMEAAEEGTAAFTDLERGEAGLWVLIHGLVSPSGLTLNGKFGTICMDGLEEGRVAVQVDGISASKRIKIKNLLEIPFSEKNVALISTLMEDGKWRYVRVSRELLLARFLVERM